MPRYRDEDKERVRDAVDFVALVEAQTELRKTGGSSYMGRCPFHEERSGSFSVDATKKLFYCFGCGEKGDVFHFVELTENVDFTGALELLAERNGIELEREHEDPDAARRRQAQERLMELLARTAAFYERFLWESKEAESARVYLAQRGLSEATLRAFGVGFAPSAWDTVLMSSQRSGFKVRELHEAGLVTRSGPEGTGRVYDRFRARITFPLANARGHVLGFGARSMGSANRGPKYLNTAENELFHKGRIVYAAHMARASAAKAGAVIVCEGYTDVLAMHQAGVTNVVASMGTALTEDQVGELGRLAPTVQLALDADDAGQEAMLRAARVAAGRKLELRVVPLPAGRDPADVALEEGAEAVRELVGRSVPFVRFRVERTLHQGDLNSAEGKDDVIAQLRPAFAALGPSILQQELVALVADRLDIDAELAQRLLYQGQGSGGQRQDAAPRSSGWRGGGGDGERGGPGTSRGPSTMSELSARPPASRAAQRSAQTERAFLTLCLALPSEGARHLAEVDPQLYFTDPVARRAAAWLREHLAAPMEGLPPDDEELNALLPRMAARASSSSVKAAHLDVERIQLEQALAARQMATAEPGTRAAIARRRIVLQGQLDTALEKALG
jgi:DNA primase